MLVKYKDLDPFLLNVVGFDSLINNMNAFVSAHGERSSFPKYNLKRIDNEHFNIELALAGYNKDDISISVENGELLIQSIKSEEPPCDYIHRGIAKRGFKQVFQLTQNVTVQSCEFINGILIIHLLEKIPEALKKKTFVIK